jgi:uncharacterized protein DUF3570
VSGRAPRAAAVALLVAAGPGPTPARAQEIDATLRGGLYQDGDRTQVVRSLAMAAARWGRWGVSAREAVDVVSSASIDVRSSPFLDAVSGASTTHPHMSDTRYETTLAGSWDDHDGRTFSVSAVYAMEIDYRSVGGGVQGSLDLAERNTTVFGGVNATRDTVTSVDDPRFQRDLGEVGYSAGVAQVLGPDDAARLRYDGGYLGGYQASPYRAVRFGDWTTAPRPGGEGLLFLNTIGPPSGLPESLPTVRLRHALVAEWVHAVGARFGLLAQARGSADSWGVRAGSLAAELRFARARWQARLGYRFYAQGAADFFQGKYTMAPAAYTYYTADKELGEERGHDGSFDLSYATRDPLLPGIRATIDARIQLWRYDYPGFPLLDGRTSVFTELGVRLDL